MDSTTAAEEIGSQDGYHWKKLNGMVSVELALTERV